jgi:hypothetical protein
MEIFVGAKMWFQKRSDRPWRVRGTLSLFPFVNPCRS